MSKLHEWVTKNIVIPTQPVDLHRTRLARLGPEKDARRAGAGRRQARLGRFRGIRRRGRADEVEKFLRDNPGPRNHRREN